MGVWTFSGAGEQTGRVSSWFVFVFVFVEMFLVTLLALAQLTALGARRVLTCLHCDIDWNVAGLRERFKAEQRRAGSRTLSAHAALPSATQNLIRSSWGAACKRTLSSLTKLKPVRGLCPCLPLPSNAYLSDVIHPYSLCRPLPRRLQLARIYHLDDEGLKAMRWVSCC